MKYVHFKEQRLAVETWANYITMDGTGHIWAWEAQPYFVVEDGCYYCLVGQREYITSVIVEDKNIMAI